MTGSELGGREPGVSEPGAAGADSEDAVALNEPARLQLVTIAADLVGRLPPDELPAVLRPFARFTPAKRARLGATQLAAALDGEDAFRARVADALTEALPQLVAAVRDGGSTAASDPIDTAVVAYLLRPPGWQRLVAHANERHAAERAESRAGAAEVAQLRGRIEQLKGQLRAAAAQAKAAVARASADADAELAALRKQLRARTGELRAAERARDDAQTAAGDAARRAAAAEAAREAESRRARARIAELERAVESARRGARSERDVDTARLWLLVETLTDAAAGLRRELSLPAPATRPADAVAAAAAHAAGSPSPQQRRVVADPAALDALLATPHAHLIVDGYNVTKTGYGELPLADQRARLTGALAAVAARSGAEITVAFDGGQRPPAMPRAPRGVRVLFSAEEEIADDLIRRLVAAEPPGRPLLVVSSDRQVALDVGRAGAWTADATVLLARFGLS